MPSRRRSRGTSSRRSRGIAKPDTRTSPLEGRSSAYINLSTVDFPAPEWPVRNTNSPRPTWKVISWSAAPVPVGYCFETLWNRIIARAGSECLLQVADDVGGILAAAGQPQEAVRDPQLAALLGGETRV